MAKHSKAKRNRKKLGKQGAGGAAASSPLEDQVRADGGCGRKLTREMSTLATSSAIGEFEYQRPQNPLDKYPVVQSNETQTEGI